MAHRAGDRVTADLALLASDPTSLDVYDDPGKQIVLACERANAWLKAGIEVRIETIVETKAQAAALAAFAIQKQLGHDAELAALEVQRRAERGVGLALRRAEEEGQVASQGERRDLVVDDNEVRPLATELAGVKSRSDLRGTYAMADGVTDETFNSAIDDSKAEGNLSRANVVRKIKNEKTAALTTTQKLAKIRELAAKGWASAQIARDLGNTEEWIRQLARDNDIDITADRILGRTRRIDSARIARETVSTLDALSSTLRLINYDDLDPTEAVEWTTSLTESIRALNRFAKQIKEIVQ